MLGIWPYGCKSLLQSVLVRTEERKRMVITNCEDRWCNLKCDNDGRFCFDCKRYLCEDHFDCEYELCLECEMSRYLIECEICKISDEYNRIICKSCRKVMCTDCANPFGYKKYNYEYCDDCCSNAAEEIDYD